MIASNAPGLHVDGTSSIEAEPTVGTPAHDGAVVVILPVVLPAALIANLVAASLTQRGVTATWAGVGLTRLLGKDVELARVGGKPGAAPFQQLLIAEVRVIMGTPLYDP